jgi:hypothetical protein
MTRPHSGMVFVYRSDMLRPHMITEVHERELHVKQAKRNAVQRMSLRQWNSLLGTGSVIVIHSQDDSAQCTP